MGWKSFFGVSRPEKTLARQLREAGQGVKNHSREVPEFVIDPQRPNNYGGNIPRSILDGQPNRRSGYVSPNTTGIEVEGLNTTKAQNKESLDKVKTQVFEQNFIRRVYTQLSNSLLGKEEIRIDSYREKLNKAETEAEAILYYNEIILTINYLILYSMYCAKISQEGYSPYMRRAENKLIRGINLNKEKLLHNKMGYPHNGGLVASMTAVATSGFISTMVYAGTGIALTLAPFTLGLTLGIPAAIGVLIPLHGFYIHSRILYERKKHNKKIVSTAGPVVTELLLILNADRKFKLKDIENKKIKYWNMNEKIQNLLMSFKEGDDIIVFFENYLKSSLLLDENKAPNEPFSEEVMNVELSLGSNNLQRQGLNNNTIANYAAKNAESQRRLENYRKDRLLENVYANANDPVNINRSAENPYGGLGSNTVKGGRRTMRRRGNKRRSQRR